MVVGWFVFSFIVVVWNLPMLDRACSPLFRKAARSHDTEVPLFLWQQISALACGASEGAAEEKSGLPHHGIVDSVAKVAEGEEAAWTAAAGHEVQDRGWHEEGFRGS